MGQQYQMLKALKKDLSKIENRKKPEGLLAIVGRRGGFITGSAYYSCEDIQPINTKNYRGMIQRVDSDKIVIIIDDI